MTRTWSQSRLPKSIARAKLRHGLAPIDKPQTKPPTRQRKPSQGASIPVSRGKLKTPWCRQRLRLKLRADKAQPADCAVVPDKLRPPQPNTSLRLQPTRFLALECPIRSLAVLARAHIQICRLAHKVNLRMEGFHCRLVTRE